jgi:hypothetical protein
MEDIDDYFSKTVEDHGRSPPCNSIALMEKLRKEAVVKKKESKHDRRDKNLLFPPEHIWKFLSKDKVLFVFSCKCDFCEAVPGTADPVGVSDLAEALAGTAANEAHDRTKRRLFCVLLFMGAGFLARHLCEIHTEGTGITPSEDTLRGLLIPLETRRLFRDTDRESKDITSRFMDIFGEARKIFEAPKFKFGDNGTFMQNENLPFLKEEPLPFLDRSGKNSRLFTFEIHSEYHEQDFPVCPLTILYRCTWLT